MCVDVCVWFLYHFYIISPVRGIAQNRGALQNLGITHILNAAHSKRGSIGDQNYYGTSFVYCGIPAEDSTHFDLDVYFKPAADFIHKALNAPDGKTSLQKTSSVDHVLNTLLDWLCGINERMLIKRLHNLPEKRERTALLGKDLYVHVGYTVCANSDLGWICSWCSLSTYWYIWYWY